MTRRTPRLSSGTESGDRRSSWWLDQAPPAAGGSGIFGREVFGEEERRRDFLAGNFLGIKPENILFG